MRGSKSAGSGHDASPNWMAVIVVVLLQRSSPVVSFSSYCVIQQQQRRQGSATFGEPAPFLDLEFLAPGRKILILSMSELDAKASREVGERRGRAAERAASGEWKSLRRTTSSTRCATTAAHRRRLFASFSRTAKKREAKVLSESLYLERRRIGQTSLLVFFFLLLFLGTDPFYEL